MCQILSEIQSLQSSLCSMAAQVVCYPDSLILQTPDGQISVKFIFNGNSQKGKHKKHWGWGGVLHKKTYL